MGPLDKFMLPDDALTRSDKGFTLAIRSHWYRSLPLSCVANIGLKVNGEKIPEVRISFELNGKIYPLDELPALYKEWWFILDRAILHVRQEHPVKTGKQVEVELELGLLIPYVLVGPNHHPMLSSGKLSKTLVAAN